MTVAHPFTLKLLTGAILVPLLLSGCKIKEDTQSEPTESGSDVASDVDLTATLPDRPDPVVEKKSIIRSEVESENAQIPELQPVELSVPFPQTGTKLDNAGSQAIDTMLQSDTAQAGGAITIWGHSDSKGSDADNLASSRRRAESVKSYLESKGVAASRIKVIALGETRPLFPNALLNGSDHPEGRAKNRRVDIRIDLPIKPVN